MSAMTSRQRLRTAFGLGLPDRVPMIDSFWTETLRRWYSEGLPEEADAWELFGLDRMAMLNFDWTLQLPSETLEETDEWAIIRDQNGSVQRWWKKREGAGEHIDTLIKTKDDWLAHRHHMSLDTLESRFDPHLEETVASARERGDFLGVHFGDPVWFLLYVFGFTGGLMLMVEDPELAAEVVMSEAILMRAYLEHLVEMEVEIDGIFLYGDIAFNTGPFFSLKTFDDVVAPAYKLLYGYARERGWPARFMHSDGDVRSLIDPMIDCDISALHPLDSKANMDVRELKPLYGDRLVLVGNISKTVLSGTKEEIEEEIRSKVTAAKPGGGYIYHSDHSVPPSVSLENYRFALECVRRYGGYD